MRNLYFISSAVFFISSGFVTTFNDCASSGVTYYKLSEALKEADKVNKLDISMQKLTAISSDISKLKNLQCLDLSFNKFSTLPSEMKDLKRLKYLNLAGTRHLATVPEVVYQLDSLQVLDIQDHPEWSQEVFDLIVKKIPNVKVIVKTD